MQVRITDPGFANLTGLLGSVQFVDGVSENISNAEAERLGCIIKCETLEGVNPSATQRMIDVKGRGVDDLVKAGKGVSGATQPNSAQAAPVVEEKVEEKVEVEQPQVAGPASLVFNFTQEQLEALADSQGIAGLRSFAEPYGIKGRAIAEIITELMALKAAAEQE